MTETDRTPQQEGPSTGPTSPPEGTPAEATTPPGNPEVDEAAAEQAREGLERAGSGH